MNTSILLGELAAVGVNAWPETRASFATDTGRRIVVSSRSRPPTPSDIAGDLQRAGDDWMLYQVRALTPGLRDAVTRDARIIVHATETNALWFDRHEHRHDDSAPLSLRRGPKPYVRHAIARVLLLEPEPLRQVDLVEAVGASQSTVSHALRGFDSQDITRSRAGVTARSWTALWDTFAATYPGAGGITTYWWHDSPLEEQAERLRRLAGKRDVGTMTSGDLTARHIAPWRKPEHATLYLSGGIDPSRAGFALASPDDHTLSVTVPDDRTVFATAAAHPAAPGHVDAVLAAFDLVRTGTTGDEGDAADRIRDVLVTRWQGVAGEH